MAGQEISVNDSKFAPVGEKFQIGRQRYVVDEVQKFEPEYTALIAEMARVGKDAAFYFASKVLKSGKISAQGGAFYRETETGLFIKI